MLKKQLIMVFAFIFATSLGMTMLAQQVSAQDKATTWEGNVIGMSKENSTLTVRKVNSSEQKTVQFDSATKWVSQYHGSPKVNDIDSSEIKEGDRVICTGTWDNGKVLHATLISKRLSHTN